MDHRVARHLDAADAHQRSRAAARSSSGSGLGTVPAIRRGGLQPGSGARHAAGDLPGPRRGGTPARDQHHPAPTPRDSATPAGVGNRCRQRVPFWRAWSHTVSARDDSQPVAESRDRRGDPPGAPGGPVGCVGDSAAVGRRAVCGLGTQSSHASTTGDVVGDGTGLPAGDREADVALLRHVRDRGGSSSAARQRADRPHTHRRAPDLADQHRPGHALDVVGARPRLHHHGTTRYAPDSDDGLA